MHFLSPDWVDALDRAARDSTELAEATADAELVIEQRVEPDVATYHITIDHGRVRVQAGPAAAPSLRFTEDVDTARAIAAGTESAQRAFMTGRLKVGGDIAQLLRHQSVLPALGDVFASVRAETTDLA